MSSLRARCPECRTLTAVALGDRYECHVCGRDFGAGIVRVPRAWGEGGEAMAAAADRELPYPEAARIEMPTLAEQSEAIAARMPARPLVLGGCCCAHVGAVAGLAARLGRIALVWIDAHGDLNTPASSPSGNAWGMPLRVLLDDGVVAVEDAVLLGARNLDPGETAYLNQSGLGTTLETIESVLAGPVGAYVALDVDVLDPAEEVPLWLPEPAGWSLAEACDVLDHVRRRARILGLGITGVAGPDRGAGAFGRLLAAAGI